MIVYDKQEIKESLTVNNIIELLTEWGGEPEATPFGIVSATICHHTPEEHGSRKLYYYNNSLLFRCYTGGCEEATFDIFQLVIKVMKNQYNKDYNLYNAIQWIAQRFGFSGSIQSNTKDDSVYSEIFNEYNRIDKIENNKIEKVVLKEYDASVLYNFNYDCILEPWLMDRISQAAIDYNHIGYYAGKAQITIPHYDIDGRFVGLRGRAMADEDIALYGKYRPLYVNQQLYNHPLGMNLYNLHNSKNQIAAIKKAIVFESEKAVLRYQTEFGFDNDISVACCGSNLSIYQISLLKQCGAEEVIVAFDRDFEVLGDERCTQLINNYTRLHYKYKNDIQLSFIFDKDCITSLKASPIDEDKDKFLYLFKNRVFL